MIVYFIKYFVNGKQQLIYSLLIYFVWAG